jgi:DNA-binding NarL/FixJ family response regulator
VEAAREIAAISPRTTLIVVSARIDSTTASTLVRAGVRGIFVKGQLDADLPETIAACHAGEVRLAVPVAADALRAVRPR